MISFHKSPINFKAPHLPFNVVIKKKNVKKLTYNPNISNNAND
jgi:hypothetical protein